MICTLNLKGASGRHDHPDVQQFSQVLCVRAHECAAGEVDEIGSGLTSEVGYRATRLCCDENQVKSSVGDFDPLQYPFLLLSVGKARACC